MAPPVLMCGSENWTRNRVDRRTKETAEIPEISLCVYAFPQRPHLATYDMRMLEYDVKWYENVWFMDPGGINQNITEHATKDSEILEDLQDDRSTPCEMKQAVLCLPLKTQ
jgi:hypothetical protein